MGALHRVWNVLRRRRLDSDLQQELDTHLALIEEEERAHGLSANEARRAARVRFGNPLMHREQALDKVIATWAEHACNDLGHAVRMLYKNPGFTAVAVASVALGIGVNTAMFSVMNSVLFRPLPYPNPSELVVVTQQDGRSDLSIPEYDVVREQSHVFSSIAAYRGGGDRRLEWSAGADWVTTLSVTEDFLRTLGVAPVIGRSFGVDEMHPGGPQAVILSNGVWRRTFAADPAIIGQLVALDGTAFKVVGVLPAAFWFPQQCGALIPLRPTGNLGDLGTNTQVVARLKAGVEPRQAQVELGTLTETLRSARGEGAPAGYRGLSVSSLHASIVGDVRVNLVLLSSATLLVLALACVNLAMLLIARFAARGREIAVRIALGSGRTRLFWQFLFENVVLGALGVAASILVAYGLVRGLPARVPFNLSIATPIALDAPVLGFALVLAITTVLALTLVPLMALRGLDVQHELRSTTRTTGPHALRGRTRNALVVAEVTLSTTLLIAAGLLIHSLYNLHQERLGFIPDRLITFVTPSDDRQGAAGRINFMRQLRERLQNISGVQGVAVANVLPLAGKANLPTQPEGHPEQSVGGMEIRTVTPNYFELLGIPLRNGRRFTSYDVVGSQPVVIVNETVARQWWPAGSAVGNRLLIGVFRDRRLADDPPREVVGIVGDTKTLTLQDPARPTVYVPAEQTSPDMYRLLTWIVQADESPALSADLRAAVASIDPRQRVLQLRSMDAIVASTTAISRFNASLFAMFAGLAIALAAIGLYGVLSFLVATRTHELGVRVALGARRADVFSLVMRQGMILTGVGLAFGLAAAFVVTRWLSALLYSVPARDPTSFVPVAGLLLAVGAGASYLPARRAATVDPLTTLRSE